MKKYLLFFMFLAIPVLGGEGPVKEFQKKYLSREFRYEKEMSLRAGENFLPIRSPSPVPPLAGHPLPPRGEGEKGVLLQKPTIAVFTTNLDFEAVKRMFQSKKVELKPWDKEAAQKQREKRPPLSDKDKKEVQGPLMIADYKSASVRLEDGSILLLKSHHYDPKKKTWVKKTTVQWIAGSISN